jgi:hypothetical protein
MIGVARPGMSRYKHRMTTRKPEPNKARAAEPAAATRAPKPTPKPAPEPSRADQAHIATAGYWREQQAAIDRIAALKAARLAQGDQAKPSKPKPNPKKAAPNRLDRPKTTRSRRWRG